MSFWACAQLEPQRTALALHCLALNGFETYCPVSLLKISTGLRQAGDFREPAVPSRSW
jgi:hypothetical protein